MPKDRERQRMQENKAESGPKVKQRQTRRRQVIVSLKIPAASSRRLLLPQGGLCMFMF